jgi:hypothetical protein
MTTTKTLLTLSILSTLAATAHAQAPSAGAPVAATPSPSAPATLPAPGPEAPVVAEPPSTPAPRTETALAEPAPRVDAGAEAEPDKEVGRQYLHGFRIGYSVVMNYDEPTRDGNVSLKDEFGLETPHSFLIGYEGMYRVVGHSWLNVILVGNVTVAGLEQSKFIPIANGLIGMEANESFQVGVGVNIVPDPQGPAHMIMAAGWTPKVGSIHTPVHFFFVPDTRGNHRTGATVGVSW